MKAVYAILAGCVFAAASADPCDVADKARTYDACAAVAGCQWCVTSGLVPARPTCVSSIGAAFIPKAVYTCSEIPRIQASDPAQVKAEANYYGYGDDYYSTADPCSAYTSSSGCWYANLFSLSVFIFRKY